MPLTPTFTPAAKDASNVDPADWAEVVSAAVDADPAMFRANLRETSPSILAPNAANKVSLMGINTTGTQLTVFGIGDSLGGRIANGMKKKLSTSPGIVGLALDSLSNLVASGTVVTPGVNSTANFQPTIFDSGRVWNMSSGAVITIGEPYSGASQRGIFSNVCVIWASKQSGGGTLTLEYSNDSGSTWIATGLTGNTVSTDGTAGEVARISVTHIEPRSRLWRITASGGPVNYVGAKIHYSNASGVVHAFAANGGLRVDHAIQGSASIRNQIGTDLGQSLVIMHFHEADGETDAGETATMLGNWVTALPTSDILVIGETSGSFDPTGSNRDIVNGWWKSAIASHPMATFLEPEFLIPDAYMESAGWNDPDDLHKDNAVWDAIAVSIWGRAIGGAMLGLTANSRLVDASDHNYLFGSHSESRTGRVSYYFPFPSSGRGTIGMESINPTTGNRTVVEAWWQNNSHANIPNGVVVRLLGAVSSMFTISAEGAFWIGPYTASFPNAYAAPTAARVALEEHSNGKGVLNLNHIGASPTWLQRWQLAGVTQAEMREDGELNLRTITTAAAYADDAAASSAGIPVGGIYRKTGGTVAWRQA